jgi:DNA-directed RNA polymerase specialized sigma24 family protein
LRLAETLAIQSSLRRDTTALATETNPDDLRTNRKWSLTQEAFDRLLNCLADERDAAAEKYLEIRRNLLKFFEWRGCPFPEDHADETVNRVARRLTEGEEIRNPMAYFIGVARLLVLEIVKARAKETQALGELGKINVVESVDPSEARLDCLRECLGDLSPENRDLIIGYYQGDKGEKIENRKKLTERLRVPVNTLRMRALRLREKLQDCMGKCLAGAEM